MTDVPRFCSYCGNELRSNAKFCNRCGKPTPFQQAAAAPPPASPPPLPATEVQAPLPAQPSPAQPAPLPGPAAATEAQDRRRQLLIAGGIVLLMGLLLVCVLGIGGYYYYFMRSTGTPTATVTGTPPTATPTGTITPATPTPTGTITPATPAGSPAPSATPEATQSTAATTAPAAQVNFSGVSFAYNPILAAGVSTEKLAASSPDTASFDRLPEHVVLSLRGYPFLPDEDPLPQVKVIPVEALESVNPEAAFEIDDLRDLLDRQPPEIVDPDDTIPYIPMTNIRQVFQACVGYLSFKNGNGVRYVTQYSQEAYPIHNNGIFYTYQGLTQDGRYYISASFPISNGVLPDPQGVVVDDAFRDQFDSYVRAREVEMSSQPVTSFTPDLSLLDALIQSIEVK